MPTLERIQLSKWTVEDKTFIHINQKHLTNYLTSKLTCSLAMQQVTNLNAIIESPKHNYK